MLKKLLYIFVFGVFLLSFGSNTLAFGQDYTPRDPYLANQDYFDLINIKPSWSNDIQVNKEVVIAVLDSGIDLDHPDLMENIWQNDGEIANNGLDDDGNSYVDDISGWDFVDSDNIPEPDLDGDYDFVAANHGTVVAGVISARANLQGVVGIIPQAKIMPLRILDEHGSGNTLVLAQAIDYAVENGADVINLSLVGNFSDELIKNSIANAYNKGVVVVAASGNEENRGVDLDAEPRYPVCDATNINRVLGVAAVDKNKKLASFSNFGENCIDISAPGSDFFSTVYQKSGSNDLTAFYSSGWSGTSVAAPVVSAVAGLLKMNYPDFRPNTIYNIIKSSAQSLQAANPDNYLDLGSGLIDIGMALDLAEDTSNQLRRIILAPDKGLSSEILILDEKGNLQNSWLAYAEKFTGGVNIAVGDINNDGLTEIITAPKAGGGPHIKVFSQTGELLAEWFAYAYDYYGGVNIAVGDVDGDNQLEIITAPLSDGGPHIRIFDSHGVLEKQWFAYAHDYYGGVNIAVGDITNNGKTEIVTVPTNGSSEVKIWDYNHTLKSRFYAYDNNFGADLTIGDVNNDNWAEIITVPNQNTAAQIKLFSPKGRVKDQFLAYTDSFKLGVDLVARDLSGDGVPEILTLPHKGSAALLKIYDYQGLEKDSFYLRDVADKNGYQIEVMD